MSNSLIKHNSDLEKLYNQRYRLGISGDWLVVRNIPYVTDEGIVVKDGVLLNELRIDGNKTSVKDHWVYFAGQCPPHDENCKNLSLDTNRNVKLNNLPVADYRISYKPAGGYKDNHEKTVYYINRIAGPAKKLDSSATAIQKESRFVEYPTEPIFKFDDTGFAPETTGVFERFLGQSVAILGVGGTGSYILDLVAKTPIKEIHVYDGDILEARNVLRLPGAPSENEWGKGVNKADYFSSLYSKIRNGVTAHNYAMSEDKLHELDERDFVFVSIGDSPDKSKVIRHLAQKGIPSINTGIGMSLDNGNLRGSAMVATIQKTEIADTQDGKTSVGQTEGNDEYNNIQVADINAVNACLATIKWKQCLGVYQDGVKKEVALYNINSGNITH